METPLKLVLFPLLFYLGYSHKILLIGPDYLTQSSLLQFASTLADHELHYIPLYNTIQQPTHQQHSYINTYMYLNTIQQVQTKVMQRLQLEQDS